MVASVALAPTISVAKVVRRIVSLTPRGLFTPPVAPSEGATIHALFKTGTEANELEALSHMARPTMLLPAPLVLRVSVLPAEPPETTPSKRITPALVV